eukprot:TRINITY_DN3750_c0_g1_i2.p1 TRINITY_DN3750_c0_g1~~TRINITY_DN3750_c0_g1_i2.p1  ORF type:complete len:370 (-),score=106.32 TRINITY_DN3750_c0_g1_i2:20-1078(-)
MPDLQSSTASKKKKSVPDAGSIIPMPSSSSQEPASEDAPVKQAVEAVVDAVVEEPTKKKKKKAEESESTAAPAVEEAPKKKKKAEEEPAPAAEEEAPKKKKKKAEESEAATEAAPAAEGDELSFDPAKKKKKKKDPVDEAAEGMTSLSVADQDDDAAGEDDKEEMSDGGGDDLDFGGDDGATGSASTRSRGPSEAWLGSDRDYTYDELLQMVFDLNPEKAERQRFMMKPPQVVREGIRRTVWVNFDPLCTMMNRPPEHVLSFLLAELGTDGSVDGNKRLVLKGRFVSRQIESLLRRYISEYVMCQMCKSPHTKLVRNPENRLYFIHCGACGSSRSVAPIKAGFKAQIGKRKH